MKYSNVLGPVYQNWIWRWSLNCLNIICQSTLLVAILVNQPSSCPHSPLISYNLQKYLMLYVFVKENCLNSFLSYIKSKNCMLKAFRKILLFFFCKELYVVLLACCCINTYAQSKESNSEFDKGVYYYNCAAFDSAIVHFERS